MTTTDDNNAADKALRHKKGLVLHFNHNANMETITNNWSHHSVAAITVCNKNGEIIYMNEKSKEVFARYGEDLTGRSLYDCHNAQSVEIIKQLLSEGGSNVYTIEKNGVKKLIHQSSWLDGDGQIGGLTEISIVLPNQLPHFVR